MIICNADLVISGRNEYYTVLLPLIVLNLDSQWTYYRKVHNMPHVWCTNIHRVTTETKRSIILVVESCLWPRSWHHTPHKTGPVPRLLRVLTKADSVGLGRAELALGRKQLVLPLYVCGDHVEDDDWATHRLSENVLGSGGDTGRVQKRKWGGHADKKWISFNMISDTCAIIYYHSLTDLDG